MIIEGIQIEEGFLNGLDVSPRPGLNVVIGARGTGKTTLIELIRFCLGVEGYTPETTKRSREHALSVLGFGQVTLTLIEDGRRITEAPDDAFGQAWHVPTPPTKTLREAITIAADAMGVSPRISVVPSWLAKILALIVPKIREGMELHDLTDRPYRVDSTKFRQRFWSDVTPLDDGIAKTARSYL